VLLRRQLRPAAYFRREQSPALPERHYLLFEEVVAGVLEPGERGFEALQRRAAAEVAEEAGISLPHDRYQRLGGPFFMLPGTASEKIHLVQAEVPHDGRTGPWPAPEHGDGSPLEEGAELLWRPLAEALAACDHGEIEDAKTELALRRLVALLAARQGAGPPW
jgi:ADP-ribose pyrophosphatase